MERVLVLHKGLERRQGKAQARDSHKLGVGEEDSKREEGSMPLNMIYRYEQRKVTLKSLRSG